CRSPMQRASRLEQNVSWVFREALASVFLHKDGFRKFQSPSFHPHTEDDMEGHSCFEDRVVSRAQADGPLTPIRRKADADAVSDAAVLGQSMACEYVVPCAMHVLGLDAGARAIQHGVHAFPDSIGGALYL